MATCDGNYMSGNACGVVYFHQRECGPTMVYACDVGYGWRPPPVFEPPEVKEAEAYPTLEELKAIIKEAVREVLSEKVCGVEVVE